MSVVMKIRFVWLVWKVNVNEMIYYNKKIEQWTNTLKQHSKFKSLAEVLRWG